MPYKNIEDKRRNDRKYYDSVTKRNDKSGSIANRYNVPMDTVRPLGIKVPKGGLKIAYIPDVQSMPGAPDEHLDWAGRYIADKRPDVVVCGGDFWDIPSLGRHDVKTLRAERARYRKDIDAGKRAMEKLVNPIAKANAYDPYMEFFMGNHEGHISRYVNENPELEGFMSEADLGLEDYGWRVHEFLHPKTIGGVAFCHYFPSGVMGRAITTAPEILRKLHMSAVAGHQQGRQTAHCRRADGLTMTAIIAGSFYQHDYKYLSPFTNSHWRGMVMLHEVQNGHFDEMFVSINFLKRKFA